MINGRFNIRLVHRPVEVTTITIPNGNPTVKRQIVTWTADQPIIRLLIECGRPYLSNFDAVAFHAEGTTHTIRRVGIRNTNSEQFPPPIIVTTRDEINREWVMYLHHDANSIGRDLKGMPVYQYDPNSDTYRPIDESIHRSLKIPRGTTNEPTNPQRTIHHPGTGPTPRRCHLGR